MKASRFLEELPPAEPELFERWQLDDGARGAPRSRPAPAAPGCRAPATRASSRRCSEPERLADRSVAVASARADRSPR